MNNAFPCAILAALCVLTGCENGSKGNRSLPPEGLNALTLSVPNSQVISGFEHGRLRKDLEVPGFSISRRPVTLEQFRTCVEAEHCRNPTLACANLDGDAADAAVCVGYQNARRYCSWSGGRLPHLSEWLLAARGSQPQRFSWGNEAPTCEQHPLARAPLGQSGLSAPADGTTNCGEPIRSRFRVGTHQTGASSFGLEDVLLTEGELLVSEPETNFSACRGEERGCIVHGLIPGAIDAVAPVSEPAGSEAGPGAPAGFTEYVYSFRCVWPEEGV